MSYTYFIYISVLLVGSSFAFCVEFSKRKDSEIVLRFLLFIVFLLPAIFRYDIAADYSEYKRIYDNDLFFKYAEPGFSFICFILKKLSLSSFWMFFTIAFITYFSLCFFIKKKNFFLFIVFYIAYYGYFNTYDQIRQALALPFIIFSFYKCEKKQYIKSFCFILFASLFHLSSLIFLFLIPICSIKINKTFRYIFVIAISLCFLRIDISNLVEKAYDNTGFRYLGLFVNSLEKTSTLGFGLLLKLVYPLGFIYFNERSKKNNSVLYRNENFCLLYILISFMVLRFDILNRIRDVVWVGLLFSVSNIPKNKYRRIFIYLFCFIGIILYLYLINVSVLPGTKQLAPYRSIFDY